MLTQLLSVMTPELIVQAIKANPKAMMAVVQKFHTFKLIGNSIDTDQQILLSNNINMINEFLGKQSGKDAIKILVEEFCTYVNSTKAALKADLDRANADAEALSKAREDAIALDLSMVSQQAKIDVAKRAKDAELAKERATIETKIRREIEHKLREEIEERIRSEILAKQVSYVEDLKINNMRELQAA